MCLPGPIPSRWATEAIPALESTVGQTCAEHAKASWAQGGSVRSKCAASAGGAFEMLHEPSVAWLVRRVSSWEILEGRRNGR